MPVLLIVTFLAFLNYAALLPVVPMWASSGGAGGLAVGSTTAVMMAATVSAQCAAPLIFRLFRLRGMMIFGALLLGAPAPLYVLSTEMWTVLALTVVRGAGFALVVIAGAALAADLARAGRLSASASLYGTAAALPNVAALAGGVWAAERFGFGVVFCLAGVGCIAAAAISVLLPSQARGRFAQVSFRDLRRIASPMGLFLLTAAAFGAASTFLPVAGPAAGQVSLALLVASVALIAGRLAAGVLGGRIPPGSLLLISALLVAGGLALTSEALRDAPWVLLVGAGLVGLGFGAGQNDSFVLIVHRLGPSRSGTASTLWNMAYDGGLGAGALGLGWLIGVAGYADAFLMMSFAVGITALLVQWLAGRD
ncbi:MFS transporter [Nesterenkonia sp. NBAIMH1]|uniref:MFS transporter n=1 Tax=Nesterenkonia sp. NBAIMH1 TaxID=2600320 RepID=UPI0011B7CF5F|nr:MFS transporter [Nesterenkonia sp. NBAIMH1]